MSEIDDLKEILKEDWSALSSVGDTCDGFKVLESSSAGARRWSETITVTVRGASGQHYQYDYESGLTECQESQGPAEYGEAAVVLVHPVYKERTFTTVAWEADKDETGGSN